MSWFKKREPRTTCEVCGVELRDLIDAVCSWQCRMVTGG